MNLQLTLALRYLSGRKLRTFLTTLAIVFGVVVVFGINSVLPAFVGAFQANMMAAAGEVDATITHKTDAPFSEAMVGEILAVEGVRAAAGSLNRTINLPVDYFDHDPGTPDRYAALSLVGVEPEAAQTVRAYPAVAGRFLAAEDRAAAVISQSLADGVGLQVGDALAIPTPTGRLELMIVGILPAKTAPGNEEIHITLAESQETLNMPGQINAIDANFDTVEESRRQAILAAVQERLGPNYEVGALSSGDEVLTYIGFAQGILSLLGVLALFMGGFIIFNTFRTIVSERRRDIGMLRAVGASRRMILGLILTESVLQGVIGTLAGLALGYLLASGLIMVIEPILKSWVNLTFGSPQVSAGILIGSIVLGIGATMTAGIAPAIQASRLTPLEALRPSGMEAHAKRMQGRSFWIGVVMIAGALFALLLKNVALIGLGGVLFFLGLLLVAPGLIEPIAGVFARLAEILFARQGTGGLAAGNLTRQPTRSAVTASSTMIGLAVVLMATSIITSLSLGFMSLLSKTLGSDYMLVPPSVMVWESNVGAKPELAEQLRALEGVEAVSTLRFAASETKDTPISLLGIDPVNFARVSGLHFIEGDQEKALAELAHGRTVIANAALAAGSGINVGDEISLVTITGEQVYRVAAIGMDYMNAKIAAVYISQENIAADFGMAEDVFLQVKLKQGAVHETVEPQIRKLLEPYPQFSLISGKAYLEQNKKLFDTAFAGMYALLIFMAVPSLIAMVNTLAIGVIERTREIGMLRAVGSTRKQIRTVVLAEALILAAIGTSFGLASGLYLGYLGVQALAAAGFPLEYLFPASGVIAAIAVGLLFGALAAVIPARQAARMDVVAALRFE